MSQKQKIVELHLEHTHAYLSFRFLADIGPISFCAFHMIGHLKSRK